ncbi:Zn-dependent protease [Methanomicrobium sp. W14]|uniref:peptidase M50 n=1 Tax=Methanomicrobium sp. W14 TaxID=2817839 RepID=UPI001AE67AE4|nr:peptidase M50 [Methanomicrobium sp. W14]MBP2134300.1 Zn-dependent protease [Methanomicrobium sp. W14]
MFGNIISKIPKRERNDLLIGWVAIAIAFTIIFIRGGRLTVSQFALYFFISLLTVGLGFLLHELAHKFMAMKYGYWAEFRKDNQMLLVAVALAALVGVVFAAPGATVIYAQQGRVMTKEENGIISLAGPLTNLILCVPFFLLIIASAVFGPVSAGIFSILFLTGLIGLSVNSMIAFFNLLPVSVLDGKKILSWNPAVFAVMIVLSFVILLVSYDYGGILTAIISIFS